MKKFSIVVVLVLCICACGSQAVPLSQNEPGPASTSSDGAKAILKTLEKCSTENQVSDILHCIAKRAIRSLDKVSAEKSIEVLPGLVLQSDDNRMGKAFNEETISDSTGDNKLMNLVLNAMARFISGRTLKLKLPETTPQIISKAIEEGRGKLKNKIDGKLMMGVGAIILAVFPFLLGGLALFATKALVIGKIALVISVISFVQYFIRGYGGGYNYLGGGGYNFLGPQPSYGVPGVTYGTNNIGGIAPTAGYPYSRSFDVKDDDVVKSGQDLAYAAHK